MDAQLKAQFDALEQQKAALREAYTRQTDIAAETRDRQLALSGSTKEEQLAFARDVLDRQVATYDPYNKAGLAGQNRLLEYLGIGGDKATADYGKFATAEFTPEAFAAGQDPGYGFRVKEGLKAIDANAAARGGLISGAALKAAGRYGQDMASQEYQNAFNRYQISRAGTLSPYQSLQGTGFNAATGISNALGNYSTAGANAISNYGTQGLGAIGGYGAAAGGAAGGYGTNLSNVSGAYGGNVSNIYGAIGSQEQQAYGNYINNLTGALTGTGTAQAGFLTDAANARASGYVGGANAITGGISNLSNMYYQNQLLKSLEDKRTLPGYPTSSYEGSNPYGYGSGTPGGSPNF